MHPLKTVFITSINISIAWKNRADDKCILKFAADFIANSVKVAKDKNLFPDYIYQNYAAKDSKVFDGYAAKNHDRLRQIKAKYDPTGIFCKLQPGYFKP
ncbi:hypothetical protein J3459_011876 [Metarhizium acridum]|uniref:uncharacterized protein n=1 Tax=Metarhizium acridum TaxID=92637 RepID=UPI001C6B213D|nr:hypothetical protein J3458_009600 [Metarhizium acridum]KAG8418960.1 hypothetical protein J3459_011876 [Metarhizium acridum]